MQSLIGDISGPDCPTIPRLLAARAKAQPSALALRRKRRGIWQRTTWRDYLEASDGCALGLMGLDLGRGDRVAMLAENTPAWLFAEMGVLSFGGQLVALNPALPKADVLQALRTSKARAVICGDQEQVDKVLEGLREGERLPELKSLLFIDPRGVRGYSHPLLRPFDDVIHRGRTAGPDARASLEAARAAETADALSVIVVTGGEGGPLELLPLSHRDLLAPSARLVRSLELREGSMSVLSYISLANPIEQQACTVLQLLVGSTIDFGESTETVADDLVEVAPTFFVGFPDVWDRLKRRIESRIGGARYLNKKLLRMTLQSAERRCMASGVAAISAEARPERVAVPLLLRRLLRTMGLRKIDTALCVGAPPSASTQSFFQALGLPIVTINDPTAAGDVKSVHGGARETRDAGSPIASQFAVNTLANARSGLPQ